MEQLHMHAQMQSHWATRTGSMEAPDFLQHNLARLDLPLSSVLLSSSTLQSNMDKLSPSLHFWCLLGTILIPSLAVGVLQSGLVHGILADQYRQDVAYS